MILAFFATVGTWFGGLGGWLKNNPVMAKILAVVVVILALWFGKSRWEANIRKGVERQEREKNERERLAEEARVAEARRQQVQENQNAAIRADEAVANLPRVTTTDGLRKHSKAVSDELLGPSPRSDG